MLDVIGSWLATILWLIVLQREGEQCRARRFRNLGLIVIPPRLLFSVCDRPA